MSIQFTRYYASGATNDRIAFAFAVGSELKDAYLSGRTSDSANVYGVPDTEFEQFQRLAGNYDVMIKRVGA